MSELGSAKLIMNFSCPRHVHMLGAPPKGLPHGQGEEVDEEGGVGTSQEGQGAWDGAPS